MKDVDVEHPLAFYAPLLYTRVRQAAKGSRTDAIHVLLGCAHDPDIAEALTRYDLSPTTLAEAAEDAFFRGVDSIALPTVAYARVEQFARSHVKYFPTDPTVNSWACFALDAGSELLDRLVAERGINVDDLRAAIDPVR